MSAGTFPMPRFNVTFRNVLGLTYSGGLLRDDLLVATSITPTQIPAPSRVKTPAKQVIESVPNGENPGRQLNKHDDPDAVSGAQFEADKASSGSRTGIEHGLGSQVPLGTLKTSAVHAIVSEPSGE